MYVKEAIEELNRLKFENIIWGIFIFLSTLNIIGDINSEKFILTKDKVYEKKSNYIFEFTLIVTLFIYIYFFSRNYKAYQKISDNEKHLYLIKVLGSSFLIVGIILLIYFQTKQTNFLDSPAL